MLGMLRMGLWEVFFWSLLIIYDSGFQIEGQEINTQNCGKSLVNTIRDHLVFGGTDADRGEFPWMASLQKYNDSARNWEHRCAGIILDENWVLTAAHCITEEADDPAKILLLVGLHKLSKQDDPTVQKIKISRIAEHEEFNITKDDHDIALLRTATPININGSEGYVNGICLPTNNDDPQEYARVAGWGITGDDETLSDTLKTASVKIVLRDLCEKKFTLVDVTDSMICAGSENKTSCMGDSGGPLMQKEKDKWTVFGIASIGFGCPSNLPVLYTRVSSYLQWIKTIVTR